MKTNRVEKRANKESPSENGAKIDSPSENGAKVSSPDVSFTSDEEGPPPNVTINPNLRIKITKISNQHWKVDANKSKIFLRSRVSL